MEMDVRAIEAVLPHRYPFLMVDRVDEITPERIVARKMVSRNEPHFEGHYPGFPVMPGVLIVEALAQTGALLAAKEGVLIPGKSVLLLMSIDKVKFRRAVVPGDQLVLTVEPLRKGAAIWKLRGQATVEGELAAEAEFLASIRPKEG